MFNDLKNIKKNNHHRFSVIALYILLMEKKSCFKLPWKALRILFQFMMCSEYYTCSFDIDSILSLRLPHPYGIIINRHAKIGKNCTIFHNVTIGIIEQKGAFAPIIGNDVYIGCNAVILGGVKIHNKTKIGASSIILKDVVEGTAVGIWK